MLQLLGLEASATVDAVKRRYRELARRYHPDVNPGDDRAHARFRAILAAYQQLLGQLGPEAKRGEQPGRAAPASERSHSPSTHASAEPRPDASQEIPIACSFVVPLRRDEKTRVVPIEITLAQVMSGAQLGVALPDGRIVLADVPPGADTGLLLRPEDGLLIEIRVLPDREYRRRGDDLLVRISIGIDEAFAGTRRQLTTPSGRLTVVVPRHSRHGDVIRVPSRGVPGPRGRGDLFVELGS
jgi:hypothetical protein